MQIHQKKCYFFTHFMSTHKIVVIGDISVGKSSLLTRFTKSFFEERSERPTHGAAQIAVVRSIGGVDHTFQVWDTSGDANYKDVLPFYFHGTSCYMVAFAFDEPRSFENLKGWVETIRNESSGAGDVPFVIVGTKNDQQPCITDSEFSDMSTRLLSSGWISTSAKTGENVEEAFMKAFEAAVAFDKDKGDQVGVRIDPPAHVNNWYSNCSC